MASYLIIFVGKEGISINGLEPKEGEIPYNTRKLVFYNTGVQFRDIFGSTLDSVNWDDPYQGIAVESIRYNGSLVSVSDEEEVDYFDGDIHIEVGYEYTPPGNPGGNNPPGGDLGDEDPDTPKDEPLDGDYAVDSNGAILKASLNHFKLVIHYKDLEGKTVLQDTDYDNVFWVRRYDEGDYIYLEIATTEEGIPGTSDAYYKITDRVQIQNTILTPPLILQRFDRVGGSLDSSGDILYYEGKIDYQITYEATAYYEPNSFDISIFINDSSRGKVVSTSDTSTNYPSGSTISGVHKNYTLKLTAVPNEPYRFGYWEVNNQKSYLSNLTYDVTSDTTVKCYFEEPIIPEDDRIATNDYINSLFDDKNLYTINGDENSPYYELRCPTKWYIKNPGIDKSRPADIIQILNSNSYEYDTDQCVKEEDISILDKEIELEFENDDVYNLALSIISIYAAGDDPTKYNSIYAGDILLKSWRIEQGTDSGDTDRTTFIIPKNLTKVYNKKLKLEIIGYYVAKKKFKLYTNTDGSYVDRNESGAVEISGSAGGTSNVKLYNFEFNTFLNSYINPPKIKIIISE
jgi:hypothetical protein